MAKFPSTKGVDGTDWEVVPCAHAQRRLSASKYDQILQRPGMAESPSMEEIPLEDADRTGVEYRVLMAYAQRRLSASQYGQILQGEAKSQEGSSLSRGQTPPATPAEPGKTPQVSPPENLKPSGRRKSRKKKKKRSGWKRLLLPSCLCGRPEEGPETNGLNGQLPQSPADLGTRSTTEPQGDVDIARVADWLVALINSRPYPGQTEHTRGLVRVDSLEQDGGGTSRVVYQSARNDDEEEIISTIVDLLRKSGDALQEEMQKDKSFYERFRDFMSYSFFRRITNQFLEDVPVDPTKDSEVEVQSMKLALVMEVTTRLTAVDNHPMNLVLGFGTKYLKENFQPWFHSHGGLEKALGLSDQEEVE